jgi:hypothetical protein
MVTTVNLDEKLITEGKKLARELTEEYGVTVSFSEVVRRALTAFLLPDQSIVRPKNQE